MKCPACNANVPDNYKFCSRCGLDLVKSYTSHPCPRCGFGNDPRSAFCGSCGKSLTGAETRPPADAERTIVCSSCGRYVRADYTVCPNCHASLLVPSLQRMPGGTKDVEDYFPTVAGIMLVVAGLIAFWSGFDYLVNNRNLNYDWWGFFFLVSGELAILAGGFSMAKYHFVFAALGSVLVALTVGPLFINSALGVASLILVIISWDQYAG